MATSTMCVIMLLHFPAGLADTQIADIINFYNANQSPFFSLATFVLLT